MRSPHPGFPPYPMPNFKSLAAALKFDAEDVAAGAVVYYASRGDGLVKIGRTVNLTVRLRTLRRSYGKLEVLGTEPGSWAVERLRQNRFRRLQGPSRPGVPGGTEWYRPEAGLASHIAALRADKAVTA